MATVTSGQSSLHGSQKPNDELHSAILRGEISYSDLEGIIRRFKQYETQVLENQRDGTGEEYAPTLE